MSLFRRDDPGFIEHLISEIEWLRDQMWKERERADRAVDELLRLKVGAQAVRAPDAPKPDPVNETLRRLTQDEEFMGAGNA